MLTQEKTFNLWKTECHRVSGHLGEENARFVIVHITSDGIPESLANCTVELATKTVSRGVLISSCTVLDDSNGIVQIPLTTTLSSSAEKNMQSEITIKYEDGRVEKAQFLYVTIE